MSNKPERDGKPSGNAEKARNAQLLSYTLSSRKRYRIFVQDYKKGQLDDSLESNGESSASAAPRRSDRGKRRQYAREYLRWLRPHRYALGFVFLLALLTAGLEMIDPLFLRFII